MKEPKDWDGKCPFCKIGCCSFDDFGWEYAYCPKCNRSYDIDTGFELPEGLEFPEDLKDE
jgi:Zn-finger nucleic acid-binding protein